MTHPHHTHDPAQKGRPYMEEADIGSGEKSQAQLETEEMIRSIPPLEHSNRQAGQGGGSQQGEPNQSPSSPESPANREAIRP